MEPLALPAEVPAAALLHEGGAPRGWLLGNGRYAALVTAAGTGFAACDGRALSRWAGDRTADADGLFLYVRDLESGRLWSAGCAPTWARPARYDARCEGGVVTIEREDDGIETRLEIAVAADAPAEVRRLTLTNRSGRARRLDVTSFSEVVLAPRAADLAHPAFSKLFVETERAAGRAPVLLARRRPRSPHEAEPWLAHALAGSRGDVTHETDRLRFLGRGRDAGAPQALDPDGELAGTVGPVLDPCLSLRAEVSLEPGETAVLAFVWAASSRLDEALALATRLTAPDAVATVLNGPAEAEGAAVPLLYGMAGDEAADRREAAHARLFGVPDDFLPAAAQHVGAVPLREGRTRRSLASPPTASRDDGPAATSGLPLQSDNGFGGFAEEGKEYVVRVAPEENGRHRLPPLPWSHVVSNERVGFVVTERGAGPTWAANSREHRLTPWANDPVSDPCDEALWIRDDEGGTFWSAWPGPTPTPTPYEVRYGFGYATCRMEWNGLQHEATLFVPHDDPLKIIRLRLENRGDAPRRLSLVHYARLVLGDRAEATAPHVETRWDGTALRATNAEAGPFADAVAFAAVAGAEVASATADRFCFLGAHGRMHAPAALADADELDGRAGRGLDPCFALHVRLDLQPGETREVAFLLGEGRDEAEADSLIARYSDPANVAEAFDAMRARWDEVLGAIRVETPEPALDLIANGWLLYQDLACRMWGRSAYYQAGGAFGFRDQLQDASALVYAKPERVRAQLLLHAAHQFAEGDVLHWWHPPHDVGIRTRFSDDLLWLPYVATFYAETTGDHAVWDERARYLTAPSLEEGEDETFLQPEDSGEDGPLYEHCCRALDRSLTRGAHGLPLMGTGDWNDGMNRVGRAGRGESVWLGFFLADILKRFVPVCDARGDGERAARCRAYLADLERALNDAGWDGAWYRRAYYDDGAPIGSSESDECRIDAIAQAWAVLSGVAPPDRARMALDAAERHLVDEPNGLIRLLTPAFDRTPHDPGYIKGYVPGVRENGGQYTHGVLWLVRALAQAGRADRAGRLLTMLSPVTRAATAEVAERYKVEPYVVAADVYGEEPHVGRGGWTWYTGSAGWMYRVLLESILGLTLEGGATLALRPCLPPEWPSARLRYRLPGDGTVYDVRIENPERTGIGVAHAKADGAPVPVESGVARVSLVRDGGEHRVTITLGPA